MAATRGRGSHSIAHAAPATPVPQPRSAISLDRGRGRARGPDDGAHDEKVERARRRARMPRACPRRRARRRAPGGRAARHTPTTAPAARAPLRTGRRSARCRASSALSQAAVTSPASARPGSITRTVYDGRGVPPCLNSPRPARQPERPGRQWRGARKHIRDAQRAWRADHPPLRAVRQREPHSREGLLVLRDMPSQVRLLRLVGS